MYGKTSHRDRDNSQDNLRFSNRGSHRFNRQGSNPQREFSTLRDNSTNPAAPSTGITTSTVSRKT
jgi:hypothetical protein